MAEEGVDSSRWGRVGRPMEGLSARHRHAKRLLGCDDSQERGSDRRSLNGGLFRGVELVSHDGASSLSNAGARIPPAFLDPTTRAIQ